nr:serine hydrolase [Candidatus Levybacteria bacterium]
MLRLLLLISIFVNVVFSFVLLFKSEPKTHNPTDSSSQAEKYSFISKRVFVENPNDILINFVPLRKALRDMLLSQDDKVSLYFEYLPSGTSIGINEKNEVRLSSLSKIPTAMAIYAKIKAGTLSKDQEIIIEEKFIDPEFGSLWKKGPGAKVTLADIITASITESDNTAQNILLSLLTPDEINSVYEYLDIPFREVDNYPIISAKNYSSVLRSLYLSSFLQYQDSNEILDLMTQSIYRDKIPSKIPPNVKIAHKIGVYEKVDPDNSTFSDCGIVYVPKRP